MIENRILNLLTIVASEGGGVVEARNTLEVVGQLESVELRAAFGRVEEVPGQHRAAVVSLLMTLIDDVDGESA